MGNSDSTVRAGERCTITGEVVTSQSVPVEGGRVQKLLVTNRMGEQTTVLLIPDSTIEERVEPGVRYRFSDVLGADPVEKSRSTHRECPECGGSLRQGQLIDTAGTDVVQAVEKLSLDECVGIGDEQTAVERLYSNESLVDDWKPMTSEATATPPDYVCPSCGRHVDAHELRPDERGSHDEQAILESVNHSADMRVAQETVGLAAGGAKDVGNFRENIANEYTPQPDAISEEGLFYDYYFETGERTDSEALFAPRYAAAVSEHPVDEETEQYLSVGLDSTLSVSDFERPRLDLVAVLDVSGSMDSPFDAYYYDEHGRKREVDSGAATKLEAATQSLCALTEQLRDDDRLGVVLFNHRAHVAKPLRDVGETDMPAIRRHIKEIGAGGGTNLADGFEAAVDMLLDSSAAAPVEQRVVFMTDMMPNTGTTGEAELTTLFSDAAADGIHSTFIGMGLDANADLAETLSGIRGANNYFIHSASEFERRLGEEFAYMVTPLVYDLTLELQGDGYELSDVYGSPSADADSGCLMHIGTLFPSATEGGKARGGVVLAQLEKSDAATDDNLDLDLVASWTERDGGEHMERVSVTIPDSPEQFAHDGVRKAVALARYARELSAWARDVHNRADSATGVDDWLLPDSRNQHERESVPLVVPDRFAERFERLQAYLERELTSVEDETLQQEVDLLRTLCQEVPTTPREVTNE